MTPGEEREAEAEILKGGSLGITRTAPVTALDDNSTAEAAAADLVRGDRLRQGAVRFGLNFVTRVDKWSEV